MNVLKAVCSRLNLYLCGLALLGLGAGVDYAASGLVRRTFVFYSALDGKITVEDRMLPRSSPVEADVRRYVKEVLLGPVSPDLLPLFPAGTRLSSLFCRNKAVYADFTRAALLSQEEGGVYRAFLTLNQGIRRNFPSVKEIRLFIGGSEIFYREFDEISLISAGKAEKNRSKGIDKPDEVSILTN